MLTFSETTTPKRAIDSLLEPFLEDFASISTDDYREKLERDSSVRTGKLIPKLGIRASVNRAGKEYPQQRKLGSDSLVSSVGYKKISPRVFEVGHHNHNIGKLKALAFGRTDINYKRRKFIQSIYTKRNAAKYTAQAASRIP